MIKINGTPLDLTQLDYSSRSIEKAMLDVMMASSAEYRFNSLEELKFELEVRKNTVNAAVELSGSGLRFAVFHKSFCNKNYWDRTANGGFQLKEGVKPSAAIRDIYNNGAKYATECATAMVIVYYKALLDSMPDEIFDKLFPNIYLMNWHIVNSLLYEIGYPKKVANILYGDRGYFANPDVDPKTPQWQGENVIILPNNKFYGHGVGVTTAEHIIRSLNGSRKRGATQSAYFMDEVSRPDFKKIFDAYQRTL